MPRRGRGIGELSNSRSPSSPDPQFHRFYAFPIAALQALTLPTTVKQIRGLIVYMIYSFIAVSQSP